MKYPERKKADLPQQKASFATKSGCTATKKDLPR